MKPALAHLRTALFPPPREGLSWRAAWPLGVFLAAFIIGCVLVDAMDWVVFTWPSAFALLLLTPWLWWMYLAGYSGLRGWRADASLIVRLCLFGLFVVLLAEPRAVRTDDSLSVVFLLDESQSVRPEAQDAAIDYLTTIASQKPEKDEVGLVTFGRGAVVELPPSGSFPFEGLAVHVERDGTSLEKALSLGGAVLPDERQGRLVLISDGVETQDNVVTVLDDLKSRGIAVDVLPIRYDYEKEVLVERLELPQMVRTGETYEAVAIVWAAHKGSGELFLQENGQTIAQIPIEFQPGKNRYVVPIYLRDPGYYEYTAQIEVGPGEDSWNRNNKAISYLFLQGEGRVLMVTDSAGDDRDWQPMARALRESERDVQIISSFELPDDPLALLPYDAIVFVNVPADAFAVTQLEAVQEAVETHGSGFLMVGGENSYGPGGYHRTAIEEVLPVTMDVTQRKVLPKSALAIVLHTCEFPQGNTWGKRITKQAIKVLSSQDDAGVLVFDYQGGYSWLFPLTPVSQYDSIMVPKINAAQIGDMPDFASTMQMALIGLQKNDAATKHMIIISDGDPQPPSPQLLGNFAQSQISISTVAVFPHGTQVTTLQMIARATNGRFYFPQDPNQLPSIFIKEAKTLRRSMIQNKTIEPQQQFPSPILKGIDGLPPLHGYTITTAKPRSTTILDVPEAEEEEPILATWRIGLGKGAAFTSDLSPNWGRDWVNWDQYRAFVHQLITDVARVNRQSNLRMRAYAEGGQGIIIVEDYAPEASFMNVVAEVEGPREGVQRLALEQVGPRRYEARFPLAGEGRYQVTAVGESAEGGIDDGPRSERVFGGLMVPYSQEFLRLRADPLTLEQIAEQTGGRVLTGDEEGRDIFVEERQPTQRSLPVFDWFLIALACLIPLDVAMRRVQIDWQVVANWFGAGSKHKVSDETFTQLLKRKKTVSDGMDHRDERMVAARMNQAEVKPTEETPKPVKDSTPKPDTTAATSDTPATTTAALVARRRKLREQQDHE